MFHFSLALFRLICSFHFDYLRLIFHIIILILIKGIVPLKNNSYIIINKFRSLVKRKRADLYIFLRTRPLSSEITVFFHESERFYVLVCEHLEVYMAGFRINDDLAPLTDLIAAGKAEDVAENAVAGDTVLDLL